MRLAFHFKLIKVSFTILCLASFPSRGAEIIVIDTGTAIPLLLIRGEIMEGDELRFSEISAPFKNAAVLLESPGGNLFAGLEIGKIIQARGYNTGVAPEMACASACALAWLAGSTRYMAPNSLIGFHAAYLDDGFEVRESGLGNALIGGYIVELGFSTSTIVFATSARPNEMQWLTVPLAREFGIAVTVFDDSGVSIGTPSSPISEVKLKLPTGFRWLVLASGSEFIPSDLIRYQEIFGNGRIIVVSTKSGSKAIAAGPYDLTTAENFKLDLQSRQLIAQDAYLSSGNGFFAIETGFP